MRYNLRHALAAVEELHKLGLPDQAQELINTLDECLQEEVGYYPVTFLHREDFMGDPEDGVHVGLTHEQAMSIDDMDMRRIADKLGEFYTSSGYFWDVLREYAADLEFPEEEGED